MDINEIKAKGPFFGTWNIKSAIGAGSCGTVYEITNAAALGKAAMKVIHAKDSSIADKVCEVVNKYDMLKGNENIFVDHEISRIDNEDGSVDVLVKMPFRTALAVYTQGRELSQEEVAKLGVDISSALEFCEYKNIKHGALKPTNIFMNSNGSFVLGDFGTIEIAKLIDSPGAPDRTDYCSPEIGKEASFDNTADLYALGMVLYIQLNGKRGPFLPPEPEDFTVDDLKAALAKRMAGEPLNPPAKGGVRFNAIINNACNADPDKR